jgi:hypothetical protein
MSRSRFDSFSEEESINNNNNNIITGTLLDDNDNFIINTGSNNQLVQDTIPSLLMKTTRPNYYVRDWIQWLAHVEELTREGVNTFQQMYCMQIVSYNKLCIYLHHSLQVDIQMSTRRTKKEPISTEIIVACYLR